MKKQTYFTFILLFAFLSAFGGVKYGNYTDARIGDVDNQTYDALLYYHKREWLYDFDTKEPLNGIVINGGTIESNSEFYMSSPSSLKWFTTEDASLIFNAQVNLKKERPSHYFLTLGIFQEEAPLNASNPNNQINSCLL